MRRRWWGAAGVVAASVAGTLIVQGAGANAPGAAGADDGKGRPVRSEVRTAPLTVSADRSSARLGQRDTADFSMLGLTWSDPSARVTARIEARTRDAATGAWSRWLTLHNDDGSGARDAERGGTEPVWTGPSDGVEVRVDGSTTAPLPSGLRLDMIDPGTGTVSDLDPAAFAADVSDAPSDPSDPAAGTDDDASEPADEGSPAAPAVPTAGADAPGTSPSPGSAPGDATSAAPSTPAPANSAPGKAAASAAVTAAPTTPAAAPKPDIVSRAGWQADESISPEAPTYLPGGKVKAVVVHHTAESNAYTCAQAPAVVRGIYTFHVTSRGYKDIGYHFLVDKCGTVYEGRKGGVDKPVLGAHAYGFNTETTGISLLGTYSGTAPSQEALNAIARVSAWKLDLSGVAPNSTVTLTAGDNGTNYFGKKFKLGDKLSFPAIHGHRDGYNTECPGHDLYAALPTIRQLAGGPVSGLSLTSVTGTGSSGSTRFTQAQVSVKWAVTTPSELISRFEILAGGKVVATARNTARSGKATLPVGTHKVAVRAVHVAGSTATTPTVTVVAETTPPVFSTKPALALRTGTVSTGSVPLTLKWKATDAKGLKEVKLTAPVARTYGPTVTSAKHTAKSGSATTWKLTARDLAGNTASASVKGTPVILQETSAKRSGTWTSKSSSSYLGGKSLTSSAKKASLTWTFTGRSVAWVVSRAATSGKATVYVDGKKAATVDLKSSATKYRDAIWTKSWSSSAKHTVKIVVAGTGKRPTITTDGLVHLK